MYSAVLENDVIEQATEELALLQAVEEDDAAATDELRRLLLRLRPPTPKTYKRLKSNRPWKWLCWTKETPFGYELRYFFSKYCDLWFVDAAKKNKGRKPQPSIVQLRKKTGFRQKRVREYIDQLRTLGLVQGEKPVFNEQFLMPKRKFDPNKWWVCCTGRTVKPVDGDKLDILYAFVLHQNHYPSKFVTVSYLAKCMGLKDRTARHAINELIQKRRIIRNENNLLTALVEYHGQIMPFPEYRDTILREMLSAFPSFVDNVKRARFVAAARRQFNIANRYFEGAKKKVTYEGIMEVLKMKPA